MKRQQIVLERKMAAGLRREAERTLAPDRVCDAFFSLLEEAFQDKPSPPTIIARRIELSRLSPEQNDRCWFLFSANEGDLIFSFDYALTLAAANIAIGRNVVEAEICRPSVADRAIAALFAQNAARSLAVAYDIPVTAPFFVSAGWTLAELKVDSGDKIVEWYELNDISFASGLAFSLRCGVCLEIEATDSSSNDDPAWSSRLSSIALDCPVALKAKIGSVKMTVEELISLKHGDNFTISAFDGDKVPLCAPDSAGPLLTGKVGLHGASRAVRIHAPPEGLADSLGLKI